MQRYYFSNKVSFSQSYGFSSSHVWMWELDYKESWVRKNWFFWTVLLEKTLENPLDCMEMKPVHPKGDQSWIFTGRTDAEAETPVLWPPHAKSWVIGKEEVKLSLFADDMILYIKKPKDTTRKLLEIINTLDLVKAMVFLEVMYGCESWTINKA